MMRLLETFFRRWWAYLIPVVLFTAAGVALQSRAEAGYKSVGVITISSESLIGNLTAIRGDGQFGYETPADYTSRRINSLLGTDLFIESVVQNAGVSSAVDSGTLTYLYLRKAIGAGAAGDSLVQVSATTYDAELSARLARGTLDAYVDYVISTDVSDSEDTVAFFNARLAEYNTALTNATTALDDYVSAHPGPALELRPLNEQIEINRLTNAVNAAQDQVTTIMRQSDEASLARDQAEADVNQRLRIVDEPQIPTAPEPRLKKLITVVLLFAVMGSLLAAAALVLCSIADRSVRSADEVEAKMGVPVLAVIPVARV
jgi:uncharacterized protein involved in exopolysaccharide biosynthesis